MQDALAKFNSQCSTKCAKFTLFSLLLQSLTDFASDLEKEHMVTAPFSHLVTCPEDAEANLQTISSLISNLVKQNHKYQQLKELSLLLPLNITQASQVARVDEQWTECQSILGSRQERIQDYCLRSLDLNAKYKLWSEWLDEIQSFVRPVHPSNQEALRVRLSKHQTITAELSSKTKILESIVEEGDKLASLQSSLCRPGVDPSELQSKWSHIKGTIEHNTYIITESLDRWDMFNSLKERLSHALNTLDSELQLVTLTKEAHMSMSEKIPALKSAFERHQQVALLMRQVGQRLLPDCDDQARDRITSTMKNLHTQWQSVLSKLITQSEESSSLLSTTRQLETVFVNFNQELKSVRQELQTTISDHHDNLQDQKAHCGVLDQRLEDVSARLALSKFDLAKLEGHIEDITSLETRVQIYEGLINETKGQVARRRLLLTTALSTWTNFMERVDRLLNEMQRLEKAYLNDSHLTIEELLERIATVYDTELIRAESQVELLTAEGERLLPLSGDIYSSAIKHNCASLISTIKRLNRLADTRTAKLRETLTAILEFESGMQALNSWLVSTERLLACNVLADWRNETLADQHTTLTLLENNIEHHGRVVTAVVNLCSVLQHDQDASQSQRDRQAVSAVRLVLKDRWKALCNKVSEGYILTFNLLVQASMAPEKSLLERVRQELERNTFFVHSSLRSSSCSARHNLLPRRF